MFPSAIKPLEPHILIFFVDARARRNTYTRKASHRRLATRRKEEGRSGTVKLSQELPAWYGQGFAAHSERALAVSRRKGRCYGYGSCRWHHEQSARKQHEERIRYKYRLCMNRRLGHDTKRARAMLMEG